MSDWTIAHCADCGCGVVRLTVVPISELAREILHHEGCPQAKHASFITGDWSVTYPPIAEQPKHAGIFPRQAMTEGWRGR